MLKKGSLPFLVLFVLLMSQNVCAQHFHRNVHRPLNLALTDPPNAYNDYFAGAGACMLCHNSMTDGQGNSIAIINDWRSTMMANSARDPFWKAKVSHEVLVNPHLKNEIETVCIRCHAPMGSINASYNGEEFFTIDDMNNDTLGMDGVSCTVCHQITSESMGNSSGSFIIGTNKQIWGPYGNPFASPMVVNTGFTPVFGEHIQDSRLCGSCHTLITNSLDLDGIPTGEEFVEQAIYHEWKNSNFSVNDVSCYNCHVPEITDVVKISTMPPWLEGRSPFGMHHLQGANVFMLRLLRNNIDTLGLTANATQFDSTINRTLKNLQLLSLETTLTETKRTPDSLYVNLGLQNLAGHKLPAGYPSRRVFVELYAIAEGGDTIFHSGKMNDQYDLIDEDSEYEPHYKLIDKDDQIQIYEMVMGDIENNVTTILEQAYLHLKDNRLPPVGFSTEHESYDTIQIVGNAGSDENFNKVGIEEGSGKDLLSYRIHLAEHATQSVNLTAKIHYQTVSGKWLEQMFQHSSEDIDLFKNLYQEANKEPVLMDEVYLVSVPTTTINHKDLDFVIYPNPASNYFTIGELEKFSVVSLYSLAGKLIDQQTSSAKSIDFKSPNESGIYLIKIENTSGKQRVRKLIIN